MKINADFEKLKRIAQRVSDKEFAVDWVYESKEHDPIKVALEGRGIGVDLADIDWIPPHGIPTYKGHQVLLYIPDQAWNIDDVILEPEKGRKFHLAWCSVLEKMKQRGRFERYTATRNLSGLFDVFGVSERSGKEKRGQAHLNVCKCCLSHLDYKGYSGNKRAVFSGFSIAEFFERYSSYFPQLPRKDITRGGYMNDWKNLSRRLRERANWTCQDCGVNCSSEQSLLHVHHVDGVKSNNESKNLEVVCAVCHAKKPGHSHMKVSDAERKALGRLLAGGRQGLVKTTCGSASEFVRW